MENRDSAGRFLPAHAEPGPGRDSLYDPSMNDQARKLALLGMTDAEIATFFGVTEATLNNWKNEFPAFFESLNSGKVVADAEVADSLYRKAKGEVVYYEKVVKNSDGGYEVITLKQNVQGDAGAAKLWLTNRQSARWRDKHDIDITGNVLVNITRYADDAQTPE